MDRLPRLTLRPGWSRVSRRTALTRVQRQVELLGRRHGASASPGRPGRYSTLPGRIVTIAPTGRTPAGARRVGGDEASGRRRGRRRGGHRTACPVAARGLSARNARPAHDRGARAARCRGCPASRSRRRPPVRAAATQVRVERGRGTSARVGSGSPPAARPRRTIIPRCSSRMPALIVKERCCTACRAPSAQARPWSPRSLAPRRVVAGDLPGRR